MEKMRFDKERLLRVNEEFKKSDEWKEFVVPLIQSLGKK